MIKVISLTCGITLHVFKSVFKLFFVFSPYSRYISSMLLNDNKRP